MFKFPKRGKRPKSNTAKIHRQACLQYMMNFIKQYDRIVCEYCGCNNTFPPHSTHHIMSAGRYPRHKELHNDLNLIILCDEHHKAIEASKMPELYERLVEERV